jgi:hypothetical protein
MHLIHKLLLRQVAKILMRPGMARYLVTIGMHSSEDGRVSSLLNVNLSLSQIVAGDEEGRFGFVASQDVEKMPGEIERSVIESQGDLVR